MISIDKTPIIFVVDDDEGVRDSLAIIGESSGYSTRVFASALELLDAVDARHVGCVITDLRMPGMSGSRLQEALIQRDILLPVIIITGHGDETVSANAIKAGAVAFLEKPFSPEKLVDNIRRAIDLNLVQHKGES